MISLPPFPPIKSLTSIRLVSLSADLNFSMFAYMIPQTSVSMETLKPSVNKVAHALQQLGYFGYLTMDCYCYFDNNVERTVVLLLDIYPYYSHSQMYVDWMKFVIDGSYKYDPIIDTS